MLQFLKKYTIYCIYKIIQNMSKNNLEQSVVYPVRLTRRLKNSYLNFCKENGHVMSARLRFLMKKDMEEKLKINK